MKVFAVIDGLGCAECADVVERRLEKIDGVRWARVHPPTSTLAVDSEAVEGLDQRLRDWLEGSQAELLGAYPTRGAAERAAVAWLEAGAKKLWLQFLFASALAALVWGMGWSELSPLSIAALSLFVLLAGGAPMQGSIIHAVRHRRADAASMFGLGAIAACAYTVGAAFWPQPFFAGMAEWLALLVVIGVGVRLAGERKRARGAAEAERMTRGLAMTARVLEEGRELRRPFSEMTPGARVVVLPGEVLPADGEVLEGESDVDESFLLGEGAAARKTPGCRVLAGTTNRAGRLVIAASKWGPASLLGSLIESIRDGESMRWAPAPAADRAAARLAPFVLAAAAAAFAYWVYKGRPLDGAAAALALIAFSVPPALHAAGPLARFAAREDERSRWLQDDAAERAVDLEMFVLGVTGLFTSPKPKVAAVHAAEGSKEEDVLGLAMVAAAVPEHPYAEAVRRCAAERGLPANPARAAGLDYYPGRGVRAMVGGDEVWIGSPDWLRSRGIEDRPGVKKASLWVAKGREIIGALEFTSGLRPSALAAVERLKAEGIEVVLASGDTEPKVRETAGALGVDSFHWGVAPSDEIALVAGLQARGKRVAAMARGLIDAPVLAQADLGLALRPGLPGDVLLERPDPASVPLALARAKQVRLAARVNVGALWGAQFGAAVWTFCYGPHAGLSVCAACVGLAAAALVPFVVRRSAAE